MAKLVVIDGSAILHRAYHALPPLTTRSGEPIGAVYGFVSMLTKIIPDLSPTYIATAFDLPAPTFRKIAFEKYQAHRPSMDKELSGQFEKMRKVLSAMRICVYEMAGYEADDLIGTIASKLAVDEVVIVTGDRDILQLVDSKIKVYMPVKGMSEGRLMGQDDVIEKMGVTPKLIPDYKALAGDASDNYPGVPGIGPKTATALLEKYGSFEGIYKHIDSIEEKLAKRLRQGREVGELSHRLATIVTDVKMKIDIEKMDDWDIASPEVLHVFEEFGFKTLTERVKKLKRSLADREQMSLL